MNFISRRTRSVQRRAGLALLAVMAATLLGAGNAVAYGTAQTPMVLQNVSLEDVLANKGGICNGGFTHVMKSAAGPNNARNYLDAAQRCGLKVIMSFPETVNHSLGRVYPSKVAYWVNIVKNHPALFGYLTVKEPSWNRLVGDRDPGDLLRLPQGRSDPPGHRHLRRHPALQHDGQQVGHRGWPTS